MGLSTIFKNQHKLPILQTLLLYLFLLAGVFYIANIQLLNGDIQSQFSLFENISVLAVFTLFFVLYVLTVKDRKALFVWQILLIFGTVFLISLIITLAQPSLFKYEYIEVSITAFDKFKSISSAFVILSMTYAIFFLLPLHYHAKRTQLFILSLLLIAVFVTIIFSYVKEGANYPNIFKKYDDSWYNYQYAAKSLFEHRNSYGAFLFIGLVASLYLHYVFPKWYSYVLTGFIYLNLIFTLCKTALILGSVLIAVYLIMRFILSYKDNKRRNLITLSVFVALIIASIIAVIVVPTLKEGFSSIFLKFSSKNSEMRFDIQRESLSILSPLDVVFGKGVVIYSKEVGEVLLARGFETTFTHNGYIYLLGSFGIVGLLFFLALLSFVCFKLIKSFKKDMWLSILSIATITSILIYSLFEEHLLLLPNNFYMLFLTVLTVVPILGQDVKDYKVVKDDTGKTKVDITAVILLCISAVIAPMAIVLIKENIIAFSISLAISLVCLIGAFTRMLKDKNLFVFLVPFALVIIISTTIMWFFFDTQNVLHYILWIFIRMLTFQILVRLLVTYHLDNYSYITLHKIEDCLIEFVESDIKE